MRLSIAPLRCQRRRAHGHGLDHGRSALQGHCGQGRNAASLRGLIGHQTHAAREMAKTVAKAIGSLPESTATCSPGAILSRDSARATR